jgi:cytidine deaminase
VFELAILREDRELYDQALGITGNAYAPYSRFRVGCALSVRSGATFLGCNVEIISFPVGVCAERSAIGSAVTAIGENMRIKTIAVAARNATGIEVPCSPCGGCRQAIAEFGSDANVVYLDRKGQLQKVSIADLLPDIFKF